MSPPLSNQRHWQEVLRRQRLANAERWLALVEGATDPAPLVSADYDNLLRALELALEDSEAFGLAYRLAQSLFPHVFGYADWDRWLAYLQQALATSQELGRAAEQARLLDQIGDLVRHKGDLASAEQSYQGASAMYLELGDLTGYANVVVKRASLCRLQDRLVEGTALCNEVLALPDLADESVLADATLTLAEIHIHSQSWAEGLAAAEKAYESYGRLGSQPGMTQALLSMVTCQAQLGQREAGHETAALLMERVMASGDVRTLVRSRTMLGVAAFMQAQYEAAEAIWQETLSLQSQSQEPETAAALHNNLGMVYIRLGEWATAREMLEQAAAAYEFMGDVYNWANTLDNLADLHEAMGETADCRRVLQQAAAGLSAGQERPHWESLRQDIGRRLAALPG